MNRIDETFRTLKAEGKKAFVAYVSAGDPNFETSLEIIKGLADSDADIIELGVPFSDPLADGIVNQMAADRALKAGMTTPRVLELVTEFRKTHQTPIVLFTYLNPIYTYGYEKFLQDAEAAGIDGLLLLDLPPDEAVLNEELCLKSSLKNITLIAPTSPDCITTPEQASQVASHADGVVVGSAIVKQIEQNPANAVEAVINFTKPLINATKNT